MNVLRIRKSGTFYNVFDDDCYILYYLFGYSIKNNKIGFPKSALNKVINKLDEVKVNYEIIGEDIKSNFKNLNKYLKFVDYGKNKYNKDIHFVNIMDKLDKVSSLKLEKILIAIENILDE